jgi:hypothetical protein
MSKGNAALVMGGRLGNKIMIVMGGIWHKEVDLV